MKTSTRLPRTKRGFARTLIVLLGAVLMLGVAPASAIAADLNAPAAVTASATSTVTGVPAALDNGDGKPNSAQSDSTLIPINRWSGAATNLNYRTNLLDPGQVANSTVRNSTLETGLSAISTMWVGTAVLSDVSSNLQPIQGVGIIIDRGAASLGKVVLANPLIFVIAGIISILAAVWHKARGREGTSVWKQFLSVVLVFVAVGAMTVGASASTPKAGTDGRYVPGVASPGWFITKINTTISGAADAALAGVSSINFESASPTEATTDPTKLSCTTYTANLQAQLNKTRGPGIASINAISGMWETSGLRTYVNAQFGADNKFANKVWCHQLEMNRGTAVFQQREFTGIGVTGREALYASGNAKSKAWYNDDALDNNKSMIAWAACSWNGSGWDVEKEFQTKSDGTPWIQPSGCKTWWGGDQETNMDDAGFNIGTGEPNTPQIQDLTDDPGVLDFVRTMNGNDNGAGAIALIAWSILSGLVIFIILGLVLSVVVALAKVLSVIAMGTILIVLVGSLFTKDGPGPKIAGLIKRVLGYSLLAAGSSAIVLLVTWMTQTMISLGLTAMDPGTIPALIWTGVAPILALLALHALFKSFKLPSPLTAKGALAWGAAGGAAGGLLGSGIANRMAGRGQQAATSAAKKGGNALLNKASGGKFGAPMGPGGKTREGAGMPAISGGDEKAEEIRASKAERAAARQYAIDNGKAVPMSASERANQAVRTQAGSAKTGIGNVLIAAGHAPAAVAATGRRAVDAGRREIRQSRQTGAFLLEAMKSKDGRTALRTAGTDAVKTGAGAVSGAAKRAVVNTRDKAKTDIAAGYNETLGKAQTAIASKAVKFAENPATETWRVTKGAAKVAGLGLATVATGGLALPVAAAVIGSGQIRKQAGARKERLAKVDRNMITDYRKHVESQRAAAEKAAAPAEKAEVILPSGGFVTSNAPAPVPASAGTEG